MKQIQRILAELREEKTILRRLERGEVFEREKVVSDVESGKVYETEL